MVYISSYFIARDPRVVPEDGLVDIQSTCPCALLFLFCTIGLGVGHGMLHRSLAVSGCDEAR